MSKTVKELDTIIGKRVRLARTIVGKSQEELSNFLGVSYQQVQKYETAKNRVSASTLLFISEFTGQPIEWFFKEIQTDVLISSVPDLHVLLNLTRAFLTIPDPVQKACVISLVHQWGQSE